MNWQEVCEHPGLKGLPFKIELNERGQIVMSPVKVIHSLRAAKVGHFLKLHLQTGEVLAECAIATPKGTKVADVAWVSPDRLERVRDEIECSIAPEICVEILSTSNVESEMAEKRSLYFEAGADEVWICDEDGLMVMYGPAGKRDRSARAPGFPSRIDV